MKSLNQETFLEKYGISQPDFEMTGLKWSDLICIYESYRANQATLEEVANFIAARLQRSQQVHSVRVRVKEAEHLLEKIIRKRRDNPDREITPGNYSSEITDLIGIRALHLFKEDWNHVDDYIRANWDLEEENPIAKIRTGDPEGYTRQFEAKGCLIEEHPFGYRSVHYLIRSQPAKEIHIAELQVRTIFEEGWSEIDHQVRYPYDLDNPILTPYLLMFNRLAGMADEMGSYVTFLRSKMKERDAERDQIQADLTHAIRALSVSENDKAELERKVAALSTISQQRLGSETEIRNLGDIVRVYGGVIGTIGESSMERYAREEGEKFKRFQQQTQGFIEQTQNPTPLRGSKSRKNTSE